MIAVKEVIRWVEPFTDDYKEGAINEVAPKAAIQRWRETHKEFTGTDVEALFEFMVVHWAWSVTTIEVVPDEPSMESHFPLST